jgi:transcriptional regulator with XRE-family HTH domain
MRRPPGRARAQAGRGQKDDGFGLRLRNLRHGAGLTQLDLALSAGISSRHLSFIETGRARPSRDMVLRLGCGLNHAQ